MQDGRIHRSGILAPLRAGGRVPCENLLV
jgi:hypothetical protein